MHLIKVALVLAGLASSGLVLSSPLDTTGGQPIKIDFSVSRGSSPNNATKGAAARFVKREGSEILEMENAYNFYYATLFIGSDQQENQVIVDTGSSDLWVVASDVICDYDFRIPKRQLDVISASHEAKERRPTLPTESIDGMRDSDYFDSVIVGTSGTIMETKDDACTYAGFYDFALSNSFKVDYSNSTFFASYRDGTAAYGHWGSDTVAFGNAYIPDLTFAIAERTSSFFGVFGIGLQASEFTLLDFMVSKYTYENFPTKLKSEGYINKVVYSLYLNSADALSGNILFGAVDHSKYSGTLQTVPIFNIRPDVYEKPREFHVVAEFTGFRTSSGYDLFTGEPFVALLDSGTTLTSLPGAVLKSLASLLGATMSSFGYYELSCDHQNDTSYVVYSFSGKRIKVPISNYIDLFNSTCFLSLTEEPEDPENGIPMAVLGDNTLRSAYIVYDLEDYEVSLAQVNYTTEENIELITSTIPLAVKAADYYNTYFFEITYNSLIPEPPVCKRSSGANTLKYFTKSVIFVVVGVCGIFFF